VDQLAPFGHQFRLSAEHADADCLVQAMMMGTDRKLGRISLSTKELEASPGDMIRDPQSVYDRAEERAAEVREQIATLQVTPGAVQASACALCILGSFACAPEAAMPGGDAGSAVINHLRGALADDSTTDDVRSLSSVCTICQLGAETRVP
jgi:hypothetical protein